MPLFIAVLVTCLLASDAIGQELSLIIGPDHPILQEEDVYLGRLYIDNSGNVYSYSESSVIRITPLAIPQLLFRVSRFDNAIYLNPDVYPAASAPGSVLLQTISSITVGPDGSLFIAGRNSDNVVRIDTSGQVSEILSAQGDGLGNALARPTALVADYAGNVYISADGSDSLFRIDASGAVTIALDREAAGNEGFFGAGHLLVDGDNNLYVGATRAIFRITPSGEVSELFADDLRPGHMALDNAGNLYWQRSHSDEIAKLMDGSAQVVMDLRGDGTGERPCTVVAGPFGGARCEYYGNLLSGVRGIHLDAAGNLFAFSNRTQSVLKRTAKGVITKIWDVDDVQNFSLAAFDYHVVDDFGNYYFLSETDDSLFKLAPLPVERAQDFSPNAPHADVSHDVDGVSLLSPRYTLTNLNADDSDPMLQGFDTREEPLSQLPWEQAEIILDEPEAGVDGALARQTTILDFNGSRYEIWLDYTAFLNPDRNVVNSLYYLKDREFMFSAIRREVPFNSFLLHRGHALMSWLFHRNDVIVGSPRNDVLYGWDGDDLLYGEAGDDSFNGGRGYDIFYGGEGIDTVYYENPRKDYGLSRNPETGVIQVQPKTGIQFPLPDVVQPDVEFLQFTDQRVAVADIDYWGNTQLLEGRRFDESNGQLIFRFMKAQGQAQFLTNSSAERDMLLSYSLPGSGQESEWDYVYQGAIGRIATTYLNNVAPLYRFYNYITGHHFFSADEKEVSEVVSQINANNWPFIFEGAKMTVYGDDPNPDFEGLERPVHRYYSPQLNRHFYTASEEESAIMDSLPHWNYEGIRFWIEALE